MTQQFPERTSVHVASKGNAGREAAIQKARALYPTANVAALGSDDAPAIEISAKGYGRRVVSAPTWMGVVEQLAARHSRPW